MRITPLAFDSFGTRSMSTFVETKDVKTLIDPDVSLAPNRFGYPPHPVELKRLSKHWRKIVKREALRYSHNHSLSLRSL